MLTRISFLMFITVCVLWLATNIVLSQRSVDVFQKDLREKANFEESDLAALDQGEPVVRLLHVLDKREVAVCGLVTMQAPAEVFLQSFRESMVRKSNPAILEIGSFSSTPTLDDLQALTFEGRDIEDLKGCVVGDCKVKLSAAMIERFHNEINWDAADYHLQSTQLFKRVLLDYVRDYLARGDDALIQYNDKPAEVRLAEEQRALLALSSSVKDLPGALTQSRPERSVVENMIVWSKIKFGLKPVIAINHIIIYKLEQKTGPQILVLSKQIYANHYFDSSLALTTFGNIPDASHGSYLLYENRSRVDGLTGVFGRIKREVVEDQAVDSLKSILEKSKANLNAHTFSQTESAPAATPGRSWRRWTIAGVRLFGWAFLITAIIAWLMLSNYDLKRGFNSGAGAPR